MAKIRMKKVSKIRILLNWLREFSKVLTRSFMLGMAERLLSGLKSLKVLRAETLLINGMFYMRPVITTVKSNQFQPSLR